MATLTPSSPPAAARAADRSGRRCRDRRRPPAVAARLALVIVIGAAAAVGLALCALLLGAANLTPDRVVAALFGFGDELDRFVVFKLRLPRILAALLVGVAFALAGAVFQSTLRNPLASPDILGISAGASLGAVWALLVLGVGGVLVSVSAFGGAVLVALVIWAAAWRQGLHGIRFVLVGVGLAYVCGSTVAWLLARSDVREAQTALHWTVGSIADVRGDDLAMLAIGVAVATVGVAVCQPGALAALDRRRSRSCPGRRRRSCPAGAPVARRRARRHGHVGGRAHRLHRAARPGDRPSPGRRRGSGARRIRGRRSRAHARRRRRRPVRTARASRHRWASSPASSVRRTCCGCSPRARGSPAHDRCTHRPRPAGRPRRRGHLRGLRRPPRDRRPRPHDPARVASRRSSARTRVASPRCCGDSHDCSRSTRAA